MKPKTFLFGLSLALSSTLSAQTLTWDPNPAAGIQSAAGIWSTGVTNWTEDNGATNTAWIDGSAAIIGGGTKTITLDGANIVNGMSRTATGEVIVAAPLDTDTIAITGVIDIIAGASFTFNGSNASSYTGAFEKTGAGQLAMQNQSHNFTSITLTAGTLSYFNTAGSAASTAMALNGGTIGSTTGIARTIAGPTTIGGNLTIGLPPTGAPPVNTGLITFNNTVDLTGAVRTLTVATGGATVSGIVSNGGIIKQGLGTLTLSGANTFDGGIVISQGIVRSGSNVAALGTGSVTLGNVDTGATDVALLLANSGVFTNNLIVSNNGSGLATIGTAAFGTVSNTQFNGTVTLDRDVVIQAGSSDRTTFFGAISGTGDITITATSVGPRIVFDRPSGAANTFVGDITIAADAILQIGVANSIGNRTIPDASALRFGNAASTFRLAPSGASNSETIGSLASLNPGAGLINLITGTGFNLIVGDDDASATYSGAITNTVGALAITKVGTGVQTLTGTNTYTGTTTISEGSISLGTIASIPNVSLVSVASGAGFGGIVGPSNLSSADIQNIVDNTMWNSGGGSFLVIDTNGANVTVSANITGNIGLIKRGSGVLTLTGTNTYSGSTIVEGGSIGADPSITGVSIVKTGTNATLTFTSAGNVDVYRSTDLLTWGAPYATNVTSPYTDTAATDPKFFYVLVPTGQPYP